MSISVVRAENLPWSNIANEFVGEWDEFTGHLEAVDSVEVRPRVSGYVAAVRFIEGAMFLRGDVLFQIDPRPFRPPRGLWA